MDPYIVVINGKKVKYDNKSIAESKESDLAKKLVHTSMSASDRLLKLSHEFKAGDTYWLEQSSHHMVEIMPNLDDPVVTVFKQKFIKAANSVGKACGHLSKGKVDTVTLKALTSTALSDLNDLQNFSACNASKVNPLFEKAYCDRGMGIDYHFYKNKFTDKLGREIEDFQQIEALVSELEPYIPHE